MAKINFCDGSTVKFRRANDGYLVGRAKVARTGIQLYKRKELKLDGDPEGIVRVYRPESAVFDENSMRSYAGKPVVMGHPKDGVDSKSWKELAVGQVGSHIARDGQTIIADFSIMDEAAIARVNDGECEISMGYSTPIEVVDGLTPDGESYDAIQTGPIVINHLAVVRYARGGEELRIGDSVDSWGASPLNQAMEHSMSTKTIKLGDASVTVADTDADRIQKLFDELNVNLKNSNEEILKKKKESEDKDEEIGKLKAEKKTLEDAAMTPERLTKVIADRVALESSVKALDSAIVCDGIGDDDLRAKAVAKVLGDAAVKDASPAEIRGMFKALTSKVGDAADDSVRDALRGQNINDAAPGLWGDSVFSRAGVTMKKGN